MRRDAKDMVERASGTTEENLHDTANLVDEYAGAIAIVEQAAQQPLSPSQREGLAAHLDGYVKPFYVLEHLMDYARRKITIHDIAAPLAKVIEVLEDDDVDGHAVLVALDAPPHPHRRMASPAAEREMLLQLLRKLAANLPPAPVKRSRGKPTAGDALYGLVERLADIWEHYTGMEFTRLWQKGQPVTEALRFTCAVVEVIDKDRLDELSTVTKHVRRRRRQAAGCTFR
jgi:hypothetical protein